MNTVERPMTSGVGKTTGALLSQAQGVLATAGIEQAALEAAWLMEHVTGWSPLRLRIEPDHYIAPKQAEVILGLAARRANREPLQYLLGTQEFLGREFHVSPAVLIPRPESVLLVEEAAMRLRDRSTPIVVDVGTGSGCLAVSLAHALPAARILAIDVSREALVVARENAARHRVSHRVEWFEGDLLSPLAGRPASTVVDTIISNPPYIAERDWDGLQPEVRCFEPSLALMAGPDGLDVHRRLVNMAPPHLQPGGLLLLEVGCGQAESVCDLAEESGWFRVDAVRKDQAGIDRVVCVERVAT